MPRKDPYKEFGGRRLYPTSFIHDRTLWKPLRDYCRHTGVTAPDIMRTVLYEWMRKMEIIPEDPYYEKNLEWYEENLKRYNQIAKEWGVK